MQKIDGLRVAILGIGVPSDIGSFSTEDDIIEIDTAGNLLKAIDIDQDRISWPRLMGGSTPHV